MKAVIAFKLVAGCMTVTPTGLCLAQHVPEHGYSWPCLAASSQKVHDSTSCASSPDSSMKLPVAKIWGQLDASRFEDLVRKDALEQINREELAELEELTYLRRRHFDAQNVDGLLRMYKKSKLDKEIHELLLKYVGAVS